MASPGVPGGSQPQLLLACTSAPGGGEGTRERGAAAETVKQQRCGHYPHPPHLGQGTPMIVSVAPRAEDGVDAESWITAASHAQRAAGSGVHQGAPTASSSKGGHGSRSSRYPDRGPFATLVARAARAVAASSARLPDGYLCRHLLQAHRCLKPQKSERKKKRLKLGGRVVSTQPPPAPFPTKAELRCQSCRCLPGPAAGPALGHLAAASLCRAQR